MHELTVLYHLLSLQTPGSWTWLRPGLHGFIFSSSGSRAIKRISSNLARITKLSVQTGLVSIVLQIDVLQRLCFTVLVNVQSVYKWGVKDAALPYPFHRKGEFHLVSPNKTHCVPRNMPVTRPIILAGYPTELHRSQIPLLLPLIQQKAPHHDFFISIYSCLNLNVSE